MPDLRSSAVVVALVVSGCGGAPPPEAPPSAAPATPAEPMASASPAPSAAAAGSAAPGGAPAAAPEDRSWVAPGPAFDAKSPFVALGLEAIARKLEGSWAITLGNGRLREAWEVKGNLIVVANKRGAEASALTVTSPCTLESKSKASGTTTSHFAFDGDTLYQGLGDFAVKTKDGGVVACVSNGIFRLDKGKCTRHDNLGSWTVEPAKCALTKDGFEVTSPIQAKLKAVGEVFMDDDPALMKAQKTVDFAAAKATLTK